MNNEIATTDKKELATEEQLGLRGLLNSDIVKKRFAEVLGREAAVFSASILTIYNGSNALQKCAPKSILNAAFQAAAFKLPITPGLGQAAIVPYHNSKKINGQWVKIWEAQFQIQKNGIIQLAHRTEKYRNLNSVAVYEGQLIEHDTFRARVRLDEKAKTSDTIIGYFVFFELINGFIREDFWSMEKIIKHGKRFSMSFKQGKGPWVNNPGPMHAKTPLKSILNNWGPLSAELQSAFRMDQAVIKDDGTPDYIDSTIDDATEPDEIAEPKRKSEAQKPPTEQPGATEGKPATDSEKKMLHALFGKSGKTVEEYKLFLNQTFGLKSRKDILASQVSAIKTWLETKEEEQTEFPT